MANNVYIGMRYVPKFMGDWNSATTYESLSVVNYNNASYTSKRPVPAGTLPTDTAYWIKSGDYNGYVSALQEEINDLNKKIDNHGGDVILIGDSISTVLDSSNKNMFEVAESLTKRTVIKSGVSGAAFTGSTQFITQLQAITDSNSVTDIYVFGGANDVLAATQSDIELAIASFVSYANTHFPNATIHIANCGMHWNIDTYQDAMHSKVIPAYKSVIKYGGDHVHNFFGVYHSSEMTTDGLHPTASAVDVIGKQIARLLNGLPVEGNSSVSIGASDLTAGATITSVDYAGISERVNDNIIVIAPDQANLIQVSMSAQTLSGFVNLFTSGKNAVAPSMNTLSGMTAPTPVIIYHGDGTTSFGIMQVWKKYNLYGISPVAGDFTNVIRLTFAMPVINVDLLEG